MSKAEEQPPVSEKTVQKRPRKQMHTRDADRRVDLTTTEGLRRFEEVCEELWRDLYDVDLKARNHPVFHSCCNCFSKRTFSMRKHYHPPEHTCRLADWIAMYEISDAKGFCGQLLKQNKLKPKELQTLPGLNHYHVADSAAEIAVKNIQDRVSLLEKRNAHIEAELEQSKRELIQAQQRIAELQGRLRQETEQRQFAELLNQMNRELERQQTTKVHFEYDIQPAKAIKRW